MVKKLSEQELLKRVKTHAEDDLYDWKRTMNVFENEKKRSEFIKDVCAIGNRASHRTLTTTETYSGYLIYGVNPKAPEPIVGISEEDDANLQQFIQGKVSPKPNFNYYEVDTSKGLVGVVRVEPSGWLLTITVEMGTVSEGQIVIRDGSSTRGITPQEQAQIVYSQRNQCFINQLEHIGVRAQQTQAWANLEKAFNQHEQQILRDMQNVSGINF